MVKVNLDVLFQKRKMMVRRARKKAGLSMRESQAGSRGSTVAPRYQIVGFLKDRLGCLHRFSKSFQCTKVLSRSSKYGYLR